MNLEQAIAWVEEYDRSHRSTWVRIELVEGHWSAEVVNYTTCMPWNIPIHTSDYKPTLQEAVTQLAERSS